MDRGDEHSEEVILIRSGSHFLGPKSGLRVRSYLDHQRSGCRYETKTPRHRTPQKDDMKIEIAKVFLKLIIHRINQANIFFYEIADESSGLRIIREKRLCYYAGGMQDATESASCKKDPFGTEPRDPTEFELKWTLVYSGCSRKGELGASPLKSSSFCCGFACALESMVSVTNPS